MSDTVQLSDQYLLASSLKSDPEVHVSKKKHVVSVSDLQQGSYTSGQITINATNQLNGAQGFASLREAYLTIPYVVTAKNTHTSIPLGGRLSRFACSLKTGVWNVISDLEVELNGKQILTTNEYKSFWNNLRAMTETSISDMYKHGAETFLQPDDWFSINFDSTGLNANGDGYANNSVDISQTVDFTLGQTQEHRAFNSGLFNRLCSSTPMIVDTTTSNAYSWGSLGKDGIKSITAQTGRGGFLEVAASAGAGVDMLKIRLVDLRPMFKELDLVSNPQIKLRYKGRAGTGVVSGQQNASFNFQLSASLKNVKYVAMIPFADTSSGYWGTAGVAAEQFQSCFDSAPWTFQPGSVVRSFQVQCGNQNAFAKTHEYDYETFLHEFSKLGSINGDVSRELNAGLVDIDRWTFAQRVLVADVSRMTEKDVPTSIQVSGVNSCSQSSNYLIFAVYEREMEIDRLTGEVISFTSN